MKYETVEEGMSWKCMAEMSPQKRFLEDGKRGRNNRAVDIEAGRCVPGSRGRVLQRDPTVPREATEALKRRKGEERPG